MQMNLICIICCLWKKELELPNLSLYLYLMCCSLLHGCCFSLVMQYTTFPHIAHCMCLKWRDQTLPAKEAKCAAHVLTYWIRLKYIYHIIIFKFLCTDALRLCLYSGLVLQTHPMCLHSNPREQMESERQLLWPTKKRHLLH